MKWAGHTAPSTKQGSLGEKTRFSGSRNLSWHNAESL